MEASVSPSDRKWIKKCLKDEFDETVKNGLKNEKAVYAVADEIIHSPEMESLLETMKDIYAKQREAFGSRRNSSLSESRLRTSVSYGSDLSSEDWSPDKGDKYAYVIDKISYDKPVHVRLAGYERLLVNELGNLGKTDTWDILLKTLRDGIADENRPVFEASLRVHGKLLNGSRSHDVYTNLLSAFNAQFHSRKLHETLPNLNTGINFKIFLHEKLFRLMKLVINHQEEILKTSRIVDRHAEEMIEQFVVFLSSHTFGNSLLAKNLNTLNVLSVLEPQALWSRKWIHGLGTRRIVVAALAKSPSFLQNLLNAAWKGVAKPPDCLAVVVADEPAEVFISGDTVLTATYLHAVHFISQLVSHSCGRELLKEPAFESSPDFSNFPVALLNSLNYLAAAATTSGIYNCSRDALRYILEKTTIFDDKKFYETAVEPIMRLPIGESKIWEHTLDTMKHMMETKEGVLFLTGDRRGRSADGEEKIKRCPVIAVLEYTSDLLKQPFSVMNLEHMVQLFSFVGNLFGVQEVYGIVEDCLRIYFFPAVAYLYSKMDKYAVGRESKTQYLDSAAKNMLLKIVSSPLGLRSVVSESVVFEELIRGSLAPLRAPWSSNEIISFVSSAAYFDLGSKILTDQAPQSLSTVLEQVCTVLEDPSNFHDPWDNENVEKFLHLLSCLSLSTRCFIAFMTDPGYDDGNDENNYPRTLRDLIRRSANIDSPYHYLGLITINAVVWNLDICVYLMNECQLQDNMLKQQALSAYEIEDEGETKSVYIVDACSLLRHEILSNSYYIRHKIREPTRDPEDCTLFSEFPPPEDSRINSAISRSSSTSELNDLLQDSKPGLRDSGWVLEARKAHKNSPDPMKNSVLIDLLNQMKTAIPTAEWSDHFQWENANETEKRDWSKEENLCFDLVLRYAKENCPLDDVERANDDIKLFFQAAHKFINYKQPDKFHSFDWFLATVFIICGGNVDRCKNFVEQITRFPSAMYMWTIFGIAIDQNNGDEVATQILLGQQIEDVVDDELSTVNYALKNHCGIHWWMLCNRLISQCFWGVLPWSEIVHFIATCILNTADYVVYYCVSLLHHSQDRFMEDMSKNKLWPDHMNFRNYRCHEHMGFIDRIGKRQINRILPTLTQRELVENNQDV